MNKKNAEFNITDAESRFAAALLSQLSGEGGVQKLLEIGVSYMDNPMVVVFKNCRVLAYAPNIDIPEDKSWTEFRRTGMLSLESAIQNVNTEMWNKSAEESTPISQMNSNMAYRRLIVSFYAGGIPVGTLSALEFNHSFTESDARMLSILRDAISAEVQKDRMVHDNAGILADDIIQSLLNGQTYLSESHLERLNCIKPNPNGCLRLYTMDIKGFDTLTDAAPTVSAHLSQVLSGCKIARFGNYLIAICKYDSNSIKSEDLRQDVAKLQEFLELYNLKCGVSRPFSDLRRLRTYFNEASEAMEIGLRVDNRRRINFYDDYEVYHIINVCAAAADLVEYLSPKLVELMEYDSVHKTTYVESLFAFFRCGRSITEAAKKLHLHRNTLVYQLKKINEILDIELAEGDNMLKFELSFKFMEFDPRLGGNYLTKLPTL